MKQKIVFFTARDLSNVGGGERMLSLIANGLCDSFSITILTPYEAESFYPFDERITIENLGFKNRKLSVLRKLQYFPINYSVSFIKPISAVLLHARLWL